MVEHHAKYSGDIQKTLVPCISFKEIFTRFPTKQLDFLSLDIEGGELYFLNLFPFEQVKVGVFVVERHHRKETIELLQSKVNFNCWR